MKMKLEAGKLLRFEGSGGVGIRYMPLAERERWAARWFSCDERVMCRSSCEV